MKKRRFQVGFTLVELLVVLAIIGLLAGLVGPKVLNQLGGAKTDAAGVQVRDFENALNIYMIDTGRYPTTEQGLEALVRDPGAPGWSGPYLSRNELPKDPWKNDYQYKFPGDKAEYDVFSYGADGRPGGEDDNTDIGNW